MSEEIGLIYLNLSQLLDDICSFLRDGVNKEVFSADTQRQAEMLIRRSKIQLQHISNISNGECYMPMDEQKKIEEENVGEEEEDVIYIDAEEEKKTPLIDEDICPFAGVAAKDIPLDDKFGYICMKTKFIFGFEKLKRVYAMIHKNWLLIYYNDKDSKPSYIYYLKNHTAQMIKTVKQAQHETQLFVLVNQDTQQKWQFIAQTHKDMLQWIARINRNHQNDERQPNKSGSAETMRKSSIYEVQDDEDEEEQEHYDTVILKIENGKTSVEQPEEPEELYEVIRPQSPDKTQHIPMPKASHKSISPAAKKQQMPLPPLPTSNNSSTESIVSYDNPIALDKCEKQSMTSETPSFSEDEEQEIYDVVATTTPRGMENTEVGVSHPKNLSDTAKKEETLSPLILSLKEKLQQSMPVKEQKEKPIPPKKLSFKSHGAQIKENQLPKNTVFQKTSWNNSSLENTPTSPNSKSAFPKPTIQPKPLEKPKIDYKLSKPSPNSKTSTKQVMKLAKEISLK